METPWAVAPPPRGRLAWRLFWVEALGGGVVAAMLAVIGLALAESDGSAQMIFSLLPAIVTVGAGMAVPPFLFAVLGLLIVGQAPRSLRREMWAVATGGAVGSFLSPALFYQLSPLFALVLALIIAAATAPSYALIVRRFWRKAVKPQHPVVPHADTVAEDG